MAYTKVNPKTGDTITEAMMSSFDDGCASNDSGLTALSARVDDIESAESRLETRVESIADDVNDTITKAEFEALVARVEILEGA